MMLTNARLISFMIAIAFAGYSQGDDDRVFVFGGDRLIFPSKFALPTAEAQRVLACGWNTASDRKEFAGRLSWRGGPNPFRDDVEFGWAGLGPTHLAIRSQGVYTRVAWDNIGFFLKRVENARDFDIVLRVLHKNWPTYSLTVSQYRALLRDVELNAKDLAFNIRKQEVDSESITKACFQKDDCWLWHFIVIDHASVIEYKYAVNRENRVARLARFLIEGPPTPTDNSITTETRVSLGKLPGFKEKPPDHRVEENVETKPQVNQYGLCLTFLEAAAARAKGEHQK